MAQNNKNIKFYKDINYPQIYVLDASAGSGKTYNLAKQYLLLLFNKPSNKNIQSVGIRNILAITFTNKAAAEMKQRILDLLKKIVLGLLNEKEKEDILQLVVNEYGYDEKQIINSAEEIIEDIIHNYHYFQVQTIDSFINQIISTYSFYLNISPLFKIEEQYEEYMTYCIDQLIDNYYKDKNIKRIFDKFINNYFYLEHRKSWYLKEDILEVLLMFYEETKKYGKEYKKLTPEISIEKLSKELFDKIKKFYKLLPKEKVHKKFVYAIEQFIDNYYLKRTILLKNLSTYFTYEKIPVVKDYVIDEKLATIWDEIRKGIKVIVELYCFQIFNSYLDIFEYLEKELNLFLKQEDVIFLNELNKKINEIISSDEYFVPTVFMKLAMRIKHCLIDEFQDTSLLQWNNVLPIIEEALANGGSLFYVGDKKQMIYRFSGSEYTLFDNVPIILKNYPVKKIFLSTNLRSKEQIVNFNNKIFSKQNLEQFLTIIEEENNINIKEEVLNIYSNSQQNVKENNSGGYVYGEFVNQENFEDVVKEKVKNIVLQIISNNTRDNKKVAILVRKKKEVELVSNWLLEAGFSVESERTLDTLENNFIKEIISLIKFLLSPNDNLSFVSFILGDIFLESSNTPYEEIYNFIFEEQKQTKNNLLYQKFKQKYQKLWEKFFQPIFETSCFLAAYDFLLKISEVFDFYSLKVFHQNYPFFYKLLELTKKLERENCSIYYFIEKINSFSEDEKQVVAKGEKQIIVMTIHKSKGLEFDIVILPFVRIDVDVGKHRDFSQKFITITDNEYLRVVKLSKEMIKYSDKILSIYSQEYKNLLIDELNILYVSFTRAKEQIYFFVPDEKDNLAKFLFNFNEDGIITQGEQKNFYQTYYNNQSLIAKNKNMLKLLPLKYNDKLYNIVEQKIDKFEIVNRQKIVEGELLHKILSFIDNIYNRDIDEVINFAIQKTQKLFSTKKNIDWMKYKNIILSMLKNKKLQHIFFVHSGEVYCEQEIITSDGDIKRVDRIIVLNNKIIVVDYKLKFIEKIEEYKKQVSEYKILVEQIFSIPTEGYILFLDTQDLIKI